MTEQFSTPAAEVASNRKSGASRFLGKLSLGGNKSPKQYETIGAGQISKLAESLPKIPKGQKQKMNGQEIVSGTYPDGPRRVMGIALIGDSAIAIVQEFPVFKQRAQEKPYIKIVQLPYGEHAGSNQLTGKILAQIDPDKLKEPRANGIVQPWERVILGRDTKSPNVIPVSTSYYASREHVAIEVGSDGIPTITDMSSNGTAFITGASITEGQQNPQLTALYEHLANPTNESAWNTPMPVHFTIITP